VPWGKKSIMSLRREFVMLAGQEGANIRALCRRYRIQPRIGYKWLERYELQGEAGLADRSCRPHSAPDRTPAAVEAKVVALRLEHPCWGGRKLQRRLVELGEAGVPSASTITAILHRHGLIDPEESARHTAFARFERAAPNELWQMDYKGHFPTAAAGRCHPLTVLDDHSRFALVIAACADERSATVQAVLTGVFRRYGLPERMLTDNGSPWGDGFDQPWTAFGAWLLRLGIAVSHGRPYHPQTQGKDERFHRTLKAEVIGRRAWRDLADCAGAFEAWRHVYNAERPHEALGLATPASRYRPSYRAFPENLASIDYGPGAIVRRVQGKGLIWFANRTWPVGKAFVGQPVALRPTIVDGKYDVVFCQHKVAELDLREATP
jgi:transposase InsO family protein